MRTDNSEIEKEFSQYWEEDYYVLVKNDDGQTYSVMDEEMHTFLIIEDNDIAKYVVKKMLDKGAKIYNEVTDLPERKIISRWGSLEEGNNFDTAVRSFNLSKRQIDKVARHCLGKKYSVDQIKSKIKELNF